MHDDLVVSYIIKYILNIAIFFKCSLSIVMIVKKNVSRADTVPLLNLNTL